MDAEFQVKIIFHDGSETMGYADIDFDNRFVNLYRDDDSFLLVPFESIKQMLYTENTTSL